MCLGRLIYNFTACARDVRLSTHGCFESCTGQWMCRRRSVQYGASRPSLAGALMQNTQHTPAARRKINEQRK